MRPTTDLFQINGKPLLAPDTEVSISWEDLDAADAGRDQSGVMHRVLVRSKVPTWSFRYSLLTEAERQYLENLFPEAATFTFTHPDRHNAAIPVTTQCYCSKRGIAWRSAVTGLWSGYSFHIIAC